MNDLIPNHMANVFAGFEPDIRAGMLDLRRLIFTVARETPEVGEIEEALRWGQPAYLTPETKSGTTIRLGAPKAGGFALFVHCQTSLIEDFRAVAPAAMRLEGRRAVLFRDVGEIDEAAISILIRRALTYHLKG